MSDGLFENLPNSVKYLLYPGGEVEEMPIPRFIPEEDSDNPEKTDIKSLFPRQINLKPILIQTGPPQRR